MQHGWQLSSPGEDQGDPEHPEAFFSLLVPGDAQAQVREGGIEEVFRFEEASRTLTKEVIQLV